MSLNTLFKGRRVKKQLGYGEATTRRIADIKENIHKYSNGEVVFVNYSVKFKNGDEEIFNSLDDIEFVKSIFDCFITNKKPIL